MTLYYRALGVTAAVNAVLGAICFHYIRVNWLVLPLLVWVCVDGAQQLGEPVPGGLFAHPLAPPIARVILSSCAIVLLVDCMIRKNLVFRPTASPMTGRAISSAEHQGGPGDLDLRVSGRFRRGVGLGLWLRDFPSVWEISETGTISLVTSVLEQGGFHGFLHMPEDRSGRWSLALPRESLTGDLEDGIVYFGLSARPALRLRIPGEPKAVVLSLGNAAELMAFHRMLEAVLAESARREATFAEQLQAIASPTPAETGAAPAIAQKKPAPAEKKAEGEIAWDRLIDFSR